MDKIWAQEKTYEVVVSSRHFPFLKQHVVQNVPLMPAAGYIEVCFNPFFTLLLLMGFQRWF